jgi:hypothetical protein
LTIDIKKILSWDMKIKLVSQTNMEQSVSSESKKDPLYLDPMDTEKFIVEWDRNANKLTLTLNQMELNRFVNGDLEAMFDTLLQSIKEQMIKWRNN